MATDKAITEIRKRRDEARLIAHEMGSLLDLLGENDLVPVEDDGDGDPPLVEYRDDKTTGTVGDVEEEPAAPPRGKAPARVAATPSANGQAKWKPTLADRILVLMRDRGNLRSVEAAELLGTSVGNAKVAIANKPDWFEKAEPGNHKSPWRLTEAGQVAANAIPAS